MSSAGCMSHQDFLDNRLMPLSQAFESLGDAVTVIDADNRLVFTNSACGTLCGYSNEELLGKPISIIFQRGKFEVTTEMVRSAPRGNWTGEMTIVRKGGDEFPAHLAVTLLESQSGDAVERICVIRDATEQKQAEFAASRLALEQNVLADIGRVISSSTDLNTVYDGFASRVGKLIPFNRVTIDLQHAESDTFRLAYMRGTYVPNRLPGVVTSLVGTVTDEVRRTRSGLVVQSDNAAELVARFPGLRSAVNAGLRSFLSVPLITNERVIGVLHLRSFNSNTYSQSHIVLAKSIADQIAGSIANSQLYAEARRAERELRDSEERFRLLVEHAGDAFFLHDLEGKLLQVNQQACEALGYTREELLTLSVSDVETTFDQKRLEQVWAQMDSGIPVTVPGVHRRKDGTTFLVEVRLGKFDASGGPLLLALARDVTERTHLEDQVLRSQKMQAVGLLAGGVAHDFNNMLSAIMSYIDLTIRLIPEKDKKVGYLQEALRAAERANRLTHQLLTFSRRQLVEPRVIDLSAVVIDTVKMIRPLIGEDIELISILSENLWAVKVDPNQIDQVLINLAFNARDAMPEGGKITIETSNVTLDDGYARSHPDTVSGDHVLLAITDNGSGMSEDVKARVFDPFYTTKGVGKGTGLGLSVCYGIVTQSGGHITLDSKPGQGTTVKVYIRRSEGSVETVASGDYSDELPSGTETILLVEDERVVQNVTAEMLRNQGYTVLEASNGEDALRVTREHDGEDIHVLLTDVVMPLMGGWELANRFKKLRPEADIIYMSGYTVDMILHQDILDEVAAFVPKPFMPTELLHKMRAVLDAQQATPG